MTSEARLQRTVVGLMSERLVVYSVLFYRIFLIVIYFIVLYRIEKIIFKLIYAQITKVVSQWGLFFINDFVSRQYVKYH